MRIPEPDRKVYPVQHPSRSEKGQVNAAVYLAAYEVYVEVFGEQDAMVQNGCRGGFSSGELVAFLYARSFPRKEWRARVDEALKQMQLGVH